MLRAVPLWRVALEFGNTGSLFFLRWLPCQVHCYWKHALWIQPWKTLRDNLHPALHYMVLHLLLGWEFCVCKSSFLTILFWTLHFMPRMKKPIKYPSKALDAYLKRRVQAYLIFPLYCPLYIVNKPKVRYDFFIMYTEVYHFLPQASLPLSQTCSTHLLITMINLLCADQNLIPLNH